MKKAQTETEMNLEKEMNRAAISPTVPKNFRQQADIEAFYRFVYENDLRLEALDILRNVRAQKQAAKAAQARVKH